MDCIKIQYTGITNPSYINGFIFKVAVKNFWKIPNPTLEFLDVVVTSILKKW